MKLINIYVLLLSGLLFACHMRSEPEKILNDYQTNRQNFETHFNLDHCRGRIQVIPGQVVLAKNDLLHINDTNYMSRRQDYWENCFQVNINLQLNQPGSNSDGSSKKEIIDATLRQLQEQIYLTYNGAEIRPTSVLEEGKKAGSNQCMVVSGYEIPNGEGNLCWWFKGVESKLLLELPIQQLTNYSILKI